MSEDAPDANETNDEEIVRRRIDQDTKQNKKSTNTTCRTRIDKLATPNRRLILSLYQEHASHFPKDRVERIKRLLQELYAMTPEETERYFEEIRAQERRTELRNRLKSLLKKQYLRQKRKTQKEKAYRFIERLLKEGMRQAFNNPITPLVSVRLRNLSDIVLEQLCDLRNINIPSREDPDKAGLFMISVADWLAIAIEHVYYIVQLRKNLELEEIEKNKEADGGKEEVPPESPAVTKSGSGESDSSKKQVQLEDETELSKTPEDLYYE